MKIVEINKIIKNTENWHSAKGYTYCCEKCAHTSKIRAKKAVTTFKQHCNENPNFLNDIQEKTKNTNLKNLGVEYVFQSENFIQNSKLKKISKFGKGKMSNPDKARKTRYEKNNGKWQSDEQVEKTKITNNALFGVDYPLQSEEIRNLTVQSFTNNHNGISCIFETDEFKQYIKENQTQIVEKRNLTKLKNNTFNKSNDEDEVFKLLCLKFGNTNVIRQYKSDKYPYRCDFYIKHIDLYIECNFHWTHGGHYYNTNNIDDNKRLIKLLSKNSKYYKIAVYVWTELDIKKLNCAKLNNLNYKVFWKLDDAIQFCQQN